MEEKIEALEKGIQIAKLYAKSLELELGKVTSERDELAYEIALKDKEIMSFKRLKSGELKEFRKDLRMKKLEAENKKLLNDIAIWRNKAIYAQSQLNS